MTLSKGEGAIPTVVGIIKIQVFHLDLVMREFFDLSPFATGYVLDNINDSVRGRMKPLTQSSKISSPAPQTCPTTRQLRMQIQTRPQLDLG